MGIIYQNVTSVTYLREYCYKDYDLEIFELINSGDNYVAKLIFGYVAYLHVGILSDAIMLVFSLSYMVCSKGGNHLRNCFVFKAVFLMILNVYV